MARNYSGRDILERIVGRLANENLLEIVFLTYKVTVDVIDEHNETVRGYYTDGAVVKFGDSPKLWIIAFGQRCSSRDHRCDGYNADIAVIPFGWPELLNSGRKVMLTRMMMEALSRNNFLKNSILHCTDYGRLEVNENSVYYPKVYPILQTPEAKALMIKDAVMRNPGHFRGGGIPVLESEAVYKPSAVEYFARQLQSILVAM